MDRVALKSERTTSTLPRRVTFERRRIAAAGMAVLGGLVAFASSSAPSASPPAYVLAAPSCAEACNQKASDCLDTCEGKFKNDDKARVTCKFECANQRQQCEKGCD